MKYILDDKAVNRAINRISFEIVEKNKGTDDICIIGIITGGDYIAKRIAEKISKVEAREIPVGKLDITKFRDDIKNNQSADDKTFIPFDIDNKKVILVDDVIYTGRSVRAAIDAIMSRGRPQNVQLVALVDRGHRELPIRADYIGKNLPTSSDEIIKVKLTEIDGEDAVVIMGKDA